MENSANLRKLVSYSRKGIVSKEILNTKRSDITLFCMAKGTELSEHTSTREGEIFVLEGKGTFKLEGTPIKMEPGVFIFMKKRAVHSIKAEKNTSFILCLHG